MPSARQIAWAKLRVTVAAVAAVAILSVVVYLLTGGTLLSQNATLYLNIPDATGLDAGSPVRVNGISVGQVDSVALSGSSDPNRVVRITMEVQQNRLSDIPADSTAQISAEGLAGDKYVAITQGTAAARIERDSEIPYKAAPELLKTIDVQQFNNQLRQVDATLTDIEQGKSLVGQFVVGTDMYVGLRKALADVDQSFREAVSATGAAGSLIRTDRLYRQIEDRLVQLDGRLGRIQSGQGPVGRLIRDDSQYNKFHEQAAGLQKSIAAFRAQPFFASDDLYFSWNRGLASLIAAADRINASPMLSNSSDYDNLAGFLGDIRKSVHDFRNDPRKFLRINLNLF